MGKATAVAHANIAFIKYWGVTDGRLNLPDNPSVSMTLSALSTKTTVEFRAEQATDIVRIDGHAAIGPAHARVVAHLDRLRTLTDIRHRALVVSENSFPVGTGLASSASAFAALSLAAAQAAGVQLDAAALSRLARQGSGSACRSVFGGYVLWEGERHESSFARQIAPPEHWDLRDVIAVVSSKPKDVGSRDGHLRAGTSPLHAARQSSVPSLMRRVLKGIEERDLHAMGRAIEVDALTMHAVMMTSQPALIYWEPPTVAVIKALQRWRKEGLGVYLTIDAGPNVHCLCHAEDADQVEANLRALGAVQSTLHSGPGPGVQLGEEHLF